MSIIYEPKGKAGEYSELAANLYTGCSHGCQYCYAPLMLRRKREDFHGIVVPRKDILKKLEKEAPDHKGEEVFLCFTCDPYGPEESEHGLTRAAIKILHGAGVGVNILTKGGLRVMRDLPLLLENPELTQIGCTLTFMDAADSLKWEPQADVPLGRMELLYRAREAGIRTWASMEPVIDPAQTIKLIGATAPYVDKFKIGRWNYDPRANDIDWAAFLKEATDILDSLGAKYYIKKDLACFSDKGLE
jgi:DNA repair photolyase